MSGPSTIPATSFYTQPRPKPTFNGVPRDHAASVLGPSAASSSTAQTSSSTGVGAGTPSPYNRKRSASPSDQQTDRADERPSKQIRTASSMPSWTMVNGNSNRDSSSFGRIKSEDDVAFVRAGPAQQSGGGAGSTGVPGSSTATATSGSGAKGAQGQYRRDETPGFVGKRYLREQLAQHLSDKATIPEDVLSYLSTATETYLRNLLRSSLSAQLHRSSVSHTRAPPFAYTTTLPDGSGKKIKLSYADDPEDIGAESGASDAKPLWSHRITSNPAAVLEALSKRNKEAEQKFRTDRMDRIARESEMRSAREKQAALNGSIYPQGVAGVDGQFQDGAPVSGATNGASPAAAGGSGDGSPLPPGTPFSANPASAASGTQSEGAGAASGASPSTPVPPTPAPAAAGSTAGTPLSSTPTFGATPLPSSKKGGKKYGKSAGMSNETQLRMSNATAARAAGLSSKKYSWMSSAPQMSSPLAGKKGKKGSALASAGSKEGEEGDESERSDTEGQESSKGSGEAGQNGSLFGPAAGASTGKVKRKSKLSQSTTSASFAGAAAGKKRRVAVPRPTRRSVFIVPDPDAITPSPTSAEGAATSVKTEAALGAFSKPSGAASGSADKSAGPSVPDDRALCFSDIVFALKRDTSGVDNQGIIRRVNEKKWARDRREEDLAAREKDRERAANVSMGMGLSLGAQGQGQGQASRK